MHGKPGSNANCAFNAERKKKAIVSRAKPSQAEGEKENLICAKTLNAPSQANYNIKAIICARPPTQCQSQWKHKHGHRLATITFKRLFQKPRTDARNRVLHKPLPMFKIPLKNISLSPYKTFSAFNALQAGHKSWQMRDKAEFPLDIYLRLAFPHPSELHYTKNRVKPC